MNRSISHLAELCFAAALLTVPWAGVGTLALVTGRDWGFGLQPSWIFLYVGGTAFFLSRLEKGGRIFSSLGLTGAGSGPGSGAWIFLMAGFATILISGLGIVLQPSGEPPAGAWMRFGRQVIQWLIMVGFLVWPVWWINTPRRWRLALRWLLAGALFQLVYSLLLGVHYYFPLPGAAWLEGIFTSNPAILSGSSELYLEDAFVQVPRLRGTMCEPLYLGNYLLLVLPWLAWWAVKSPWLRVLLGLMVGLMVLTWSRGAWLAGLGLLIPAGFLLAVWRRGDGSVGLFSQRYRGFLLFLGLGILVLLALFLWSDWPVFQFPRQRLAQTFSTRDWSNLTRVYSMQAAWRAFLASPVVGVGWGQFSFHFPLLVDPEGLQSQFSWPVVNNFPLKILAETGVLGFLVFLLGVGGVLNRAVRSLFSLPAEWRSGILAALFSALGVGLQLLTFSQYNLPHIWLAWGLLLAALARPEALAGARPGRPETRDGEEVAIT